MQQFIIKSYGKSELAHLYRPNVEPASALRTLNNWIGRNPALQRDLKQAGWHVKVHDLTPRQVAILVHYFGEP